MGVFTLRDQLIGDYADYIQSFINIRDSRIQQYMDPELRSGLLWPEPLLQLNLSFEPGPRIDDLVDRQVLQPLCRRSSTLNPKANLITTFLQKTHYHLNILRQREAKYGGNALLELLDQVEAHQNAIALTEQAGSKASWILP